MHISPMVILQRDTLRSHVAQHRRRAWVSAVVGVFMLVVGVAAGIVLPSRAGAEGLGSNAFNPARDSRSTRPCEVYGWREVRARVWAPFPSESREYHWADRVPTWRDDGREIVFADGNAVYAASVDGTKLRRPVREDTTEFYVDGQWRYALKGFVSLDVSSVDGALVCMRRVGPIGPRETNRRFHAAASL